MKKTFLLFRAIHHLTCHDGSLLKSICAYHILRRKQRILLEPTVSVQSEVSACFTWLPLSFVFHRQVKLGEDAPNSSVVHVSNPEGGDASGNGAQAKTVDGTECHLLDFASPERPLVVNFGSAT